MPEEAKKGEEKETQQETQKGTQLESGSKTAQQMEQTTPSLDSVVLTKEQYSAILDRMDELEQEASSKRSDKGSKGGRQTVDDLAREAKPRKESEEKVPPLDLEGMTNTELVQFIFRAAEEHIVQPMSVQLQTIKVMGEIDKCFAKHDDFYDYQDRVREIAIENPTLSIEKAYKMARLEAKEEEEAEEAGEEGSAKGESKGKTGAKPKKGVQLLIPPRAVLGERPGTAGAATKVGQAKTVKQAAERAWDSVMQGREA